MPNFGSLGQPIRARDTDPIRHLRTVMDQLTDELNVVRKTECGDRIETMPDAKKRKAKERGEVDVVEELASLEPYPTTESSLLHGLGLLEHQITRYSTDQDSISIIPKGKKKAKKFRISQLLEDIANEFLRLIKLRKKKEKAAKEELKKEREQEKKESKGEEPQI